MNAGQVPDVLVDDTALALAIRAVRDRQLHLVAVERNESGIQPDTATPSSRTAT